MKKSTRAAVSGLAAFGTTAAQGIPFDETGANDLGDTFQTRTFLPSNIDLILGAGDDDYFQLPGVGINEPFRLEIDASCGAESGSGGGAPNCSAVELGPVLVTVGASALNAVFEYGFLGEETFSVQTNSGGTGGGSESGSEPSGSGSGSPPSGSGSGSGEESGKSAGTTGSGEESGQSGGTTGSGGESASGSEEQSGSGGSGPTTTSLGPVFSFYNDDGNLVVSFELPGLTPTVSPFVITGTGSKLGLNGRMEWTGPYSIGINQATGVPEPSTGALAMAAGTASGAARRRKKRRKR